MAFTRIHELATNQVCYSLQVACRPWQSSSRAWRVSLQRSRNRDFRAWKAFYKKRRDFLLGTRAFMWYAFPEYFILFLFALFWVLVFVFCFCFPGFFNLFLFSFVFIWCFIVCFATFWLRLLAVGWSLRCCFVVLLICNVHCEWGSRFDLPRISMPFVSISHPLITARRWKFAKLQR